MSVIKNLVKNLGDFQMRVDEFLIPDDGVTLFWGSSGSGKTTLIRLLTGLIECDGLEWWMEGQNVTLLPPSRRQVSVVFQHLALFPHLTARENIFFPLAGRVPTAEEEKNWQTLQDLLGLREFLDRKTRRLSGGERQRVALARALIVRPRLLILDEPFSALDYQLKKQARELLNSIVKERNIPLWMVSHDPLDVEILAQRVVVLDKGRITALQSPEEFLKSLH